MALLSRIKSPEWQNGDTLTHTDLIAEFNNIVNGLNGAADISVIDITCDDITGDVFTANSIVVSGMANVSANANFTTNINVTGNAAITGNVTVAGTFTSTGQIQGPQRDLGSIDNLGLSLASGVLKIVDAAGANLSATNLGFVTVPSVTAGRNVTLKANSNALLISDAAGTSDLTDLQWGVTAAADWAQDVPFFIYVVNKADNAITGTDGDSAFALARNPALRVMPAAAANIGNTGAIAATDDQFAVMLLGAYTVANYVNLPVQQVGCIRMRYSTTGDDWTIQTLSATIDGLGPEQLRKCFATQWTMAVAQNGSEAGKYFTSTDGGTTLAFSATNECYYMVHPDGQFSVFYNFDNQSANGGDGTAVRWVLPYATSSTPAVQTAGCGRVDVAGVAGTCVLSASAGSTFCTALNETTGTILDNDFSNTADIFRGKATFKAY